jgi:WD40 repeat protein
MREQYLIHSQGESVCVWDIPEQSCITVFSGHTAAVHTVALRPNNTVISASREEILVWEANTEKVFSYHPGCTAFAAHPTLNQIATSHKDGTISILNPLAAAPLRSFEGPEIKNCEISALVWSSATHLLVAKGKLIYLIDTTSSKIERIYQGHQGSILHIEGFSHENASASLTESSNFATHFFSLCSNDEVMCWQTESGTVTSKTQARGKCSSLFVLDDRHSKTLNTQLLLPILVDPEGVTVIATKEPNHIKMEDADIPISAISLISASTPVLLI